MISYRAADLRLFYAYAKSRFSHDTVQLRASSTYHFRFRFKLNKFLGNSKNNSIILGREILVLIDRSI